MGYPIVPAIDYSYTGFQQSQGDNAFPGTQLDNDLLALRDALMSTTAFIEVSFASDGSVKPSAFPDNIAAGPPGPPGAPGERGPQGLPGEPGADGGAILDLANTFTQPQTIQTASAQWPLTLMGSSFASARIRTERPLAGAGMSLGGWEAFGQNSVAAQKSYAAVLAAIVDDTAGSEDGRAIIVTTQNGTSTAVMNFGAGQYAGSLTDPGAGIINAVGFQQGGIALPAPANIVVKDGSVAMTGALNLGIHKITGVDTPAIASDAATKAYVDSQVSGTFPHLACTCATTANIALTGAQTIDGVASGTSRILVKNQTAPAQNGIYVAAAGAWARASDMDFPAEVSGTVPVTGGITQSNTIWGIIAAVVTVGTDPINFTQISSGNVIVADGTTIVQSGNTFSVGTIPVANVTGAVPNTRTVVGADLAVSAPVGGALSANQTITVTKATQAEAAVGVRNDVAVTPFALTGGLTAKTVAGSGLVTVTGGTLAGNNTITVPKATLAEAQAGTLDTVAMTPLRAEDHAKAWANRGIRGAVTGATVATAYPYTVGGFVGGLGNYIATHTFEAVSTEVKAMNDYTVDIAYDTKAGAAFAAGQTVTATSGWSGKIKSFTSTVLTLREKVGPANPTNNETITASGGGTALVNDTLFRNQTFDDTGDVEFLYDNHFTVAITNQGAGYTYTNPSSVGKVDYALLVQGSRGVDNDDYLTDTQKGQQGALIVQLYSPRGADGTAVSWQNRSVYVPLGVTPATSGAKSGVEGNLILVHENNETLINFGGFVGTAIPYDNTSSKWGPRGVSVFRAQLSVLPATVTLGTVAAPLPGQPNPVFAYAAFLVEENSHITQGIRYALAAHQHQLLAPYFKITGAAHSDGRGLVRASNGTRQNPAYGGIEEGTGVDWRGTGMWFPGDGTIAFSVAANPGEDGVERLRINNTGLRWNGTQVVGARQTGWLSQSGTASRAAWAGYTKDTATGTYSQAFAQNAFNALETLSQRYMALHADLVSHGLIGA